MSAREAARAHYFSRRRLVEAVSEMARRSWSRLNPANLNASWEAELPELLVGLAGAQLAAARPADTYADEALGEASPPVVNPGAFAGIASDGRPLATLLLNPVTVVKTAISPDIDEAMATGQPMLDVGRAMAAGYANLDMLVRTQVADAGRAADQVALVARPQAEGYTRMLVGDSCSRCILLAGRWYRWSDGFLRHPRCDCVHVPGRDPDGGAQLSPTRIFTAMTQTDQDRTFTKVGAQAIRDGADMGRVVNARRGMYKAGGLRFTTEATTKRGISRKVRLMPEQIYREANGDRDEALRLLRLHGYLLNLSRPTRTPVPAASRPAPARTAPAPAPVVRGTDRLTEEARRYDSNPERFLQLGLQMRQVKYDVVLAEVGQRQSFGGLPRQGTRAEVDAAVKAGWTEIWRGVVGSEATGQTPAQINGRLRTGAYEPGRGIYGNGWYFSERRITAENFREREPKTNYPAGGGPDFELSDLEGETTPDSLLRVALDPAARLIDYDELARLVRRWEATQPEGTLAAKIFSDPGRFATALGYDGIRIPGDRGDGGFYPGWEDEDDPGGAVQIVILNRTVMLIQRVEDVP